MDTQAKPTGRELDRGATGRLEGLLNSAFVGSLCLPLLPLLAFLGVLAGRTTPIVLRITQFGLLAGLAITAWRGARYLGAWFTEATDSH
jgi:hypothetical protein